VEKAISMVGRILGYYRIRRQLSRGVAVK